MFDRGRVLHPSVAARLARLAADQRAAATAPPGPILCVAPAGSGKTTTLVARIAWLIDGGTDPGTIAAITFNKRAAGELGDRLADALAPLGVAPGAVRVRTFHALGLEILRSAGRPVEPLVDRLVVLRQVVPNAGPADRRRLDDAFSRLKLDLGVTADQIAADPEAGAVARAFVAYEREIERLGGLDFDDLVARALRVLEAEPAVLAGWRAACANLLVDEVQDVDRSQLRLALLLAAPAHRIFLVGDDDQSLSIFRTGSTAAGRHGNLLERRAQLLGEDGRPAGVRDRNHEQLPNGMYRTQVGLSGSVETRAASGLPSVAQDRGDQHWVRRLEFVSTFPRVGEFMDDIWFEYVGRDRGEHRIPYRVGQTTHIERVPQHAALLRFVSDHDPPQG